MKRHTNFCLQIDYQTIDEEVRIQQFNNEQRHGKAFNSEHEFYAVLLEEVEKFWESIKDEDPDPKQLIDILAVARGGCIWLCDKSRRELNKD